MFEFIGAKLWFWLVLGGIGFLGSLFFGMLIFILKSTPTHRKIVNTGLVAFLAFTIANWILFLAALAIRTW